MALLSFPFHAWTPHIQRTQKRPNFILNGNSGQQKGKNKKAHVRAFLPPLQCGSEVKNNVRTERSRDWQVQWEDGN